MAVKFHPFTDIIERFIFFLFTWTSCTILLYTSELPIVIKGQIVHF